MTLARLFFFSVLGILLMSPLIGDEHDEDTCQRMLQRVEQRMQEVTYIQEHSGEAKGPLLFAAARQWQFWAFAGALALFFRLCWCLWRRSCEPESSCNHGSSRNLQDEEECVTESEADYDMEEEEYGLNRERFSLLSMSQHLLTRQKTYTAVEELVNDLLSCCNYLSLGGFLPQLQPAIRLDSFMEEQSACEKEYVYRLLVPVKPPLGHSFHLDLGTEGQKPVKNSCLRVSLECMCKREQLLGDVLCFLHHPEDKLRSSQEESLLETLCTSSSHLDMRKTNLWLQETMKQSCFLKKATNNLRVVPSSHFCKLKLTDTFNESIVIELVLAVQQGDSDKFVILQ